MPGLPVNGKCGHSAPDFAHMPCCTLLLSLTFSSSSQLTLYSSHADIFALISLSLLYALSEISLYPFSCNSWSLTCVFLIGPVIIFSRKNSNARQLSSNQHLPVTLWSNKHNVWTCISGCHYIYNGVVGNIYDVYRRHAPLRYRVEHDVLRRHSHLTVSTFHKSRTVLTTKYNEQVDITVMIRS
jgi:hypothetical protein